MTQPEDPTSAMTETGADDATVDTAVDPAAVEVPVDVPVEAAPVEPVEVQDLPPAAVELDEATVDGPAATTGTDTDADVNAGVNTNAGVETDTDTLPDVLLAAEPMTPERLVAAVEAILFVVESPVTLPAIASALQVPVPDVAEAVATLTADYDRRGAGVEVRPAADGVRVYTRPDHAKAVEAFLQDGQRSRLTQAALETLAVVAYRQPVTRARVSAIRGVNCDGVVRTLTTRGLIEEVGTDPDTGGGLLQTTELFLERMGLTELGELPSLAPLLPEIDGLEIDEL